MVRFTPAIDQPQKETLFRYQRIANLSLLRILDSVAEIRIGKGDGRSRDAIQLLHPLRRILRQFQDVIEKILVHGMPRRWNIENGAFTKISLEG